MTDSVVKVVEATTGTNLAAVTFTNALGDTVKATEVTLVSEAGVNISPLTDTQLRATAVPVSGTVTVNGTVGISGNVEVTNDVGNPLPVSGTVTANAGTGTFGVQLASGIGTTVANPAFITWSLGGAAASATNPAPVQLSQGNAAASATNPLPAQLSVGNAAASQTNPVPIAAQPATLFANTQSAANTAVTLTLPAVAGQFHYITSIQLRRANTSATAVAAAAANLAYTSTNINGGATLARTANVAAAGTSYVDFDRSFAQPLKSQTVNTATTISAPAAGAGVQCEIVVTYYTAP